MIKSNFHSHTKYCSHAIFTVEELLEKAYNFGYESFGISEHSHIEGTKGQYRIYDEEAAKNYIKDVKTFKEQYKGKMNVFCGFEVEPINYIESRSHVDFLKKLENEKDVDYLIIGNHYYVGEGAGEKTWVQSFFQPSWMQAKAYIDHLEEVIKNCEKVILIAHPDVFYARDQKWSEELEYIKQGIYRVSKEYDIPLGINVNALAESRYHPIQDFWNGAARYGCKAVIELDCHGETPFNKEWIEKAMNVAKIANIELVDDAYAYHFKK